MSATVTLKVIDGSLPGKEFVFGGRTKCLVGRAADCNLQVPGDVWSCTVSRHHCLLDIDPPAIRVRDLGSLNGTYINGAKIGQRDKGLTPEEAALLELRQHSLHEGDEIQVGNWVFRVEVATAVSGAQEAREVPEEQKPWVQELPGSNECKVCCS